MKKAFLGVDPGLTGGWSLIDEDMKIIKFGVFEFIINDFDAFAFSEIVRKFKEEYEILACFENVGAMPKQGGCAMFTFGKITGEIIAVLKVLQIPYIEPKPMAWKKLVLAGLPWKADFKTFKADKKWSEEELKLETKKHNAIKSKAKKEAKKIACMYVMRQYPTIDIKFGKKNYHDGIGDAICLAQYAYFFKNGRT